jgi:hypothetical protein
VVRTRLLRLAKLTLGYALVVLGVAGFFLPFLQGILFTVAGLVILADEARWARWILLKVRRRFPTHYRRAVATRRRIDGGVRGAWRRFSGFFRGAGKSAGEVGSNGDPDDG